MAGPGAAAPVGWYASVTTLGIVPPEYHYILRMVSWFFVTLALIPLVPVALLLLCDLVLYFWRLAIRQAKSRRRARPGCQPSSTQTPDRRSRPPTDTAILNLSDKKEKFG